MSKLFDYKAVLTVASRRAFVNDVEIRCLLQHMLDQNEVSNVDSALNTCSQALLFQFPCLNKLNLSEINEYNALEFLKPALCALGRDVEVPHKCAVMTHNK